MSQEIAIIATNARPISPNMTYVREETITVSEPLTDAERLEYGQEMADALAKIEEYEAALDAERKHYKRLIETQEKIAQTASKHYRDGKVTETMMDNPIKQMRRQRDIVKSILTAAGENVWIDSVLYFSSPNAKLKISLRESDYVCCESAELLEFLKSYDSGETLSKSRMEHIAQILRESSGV